MSDPEKLCPICGRPGTGPYSRYVLNDRKQKFGPYYYFAHKRGKHVDWCYIPKRMAKSRLVQLSNQLSNQVQEKPTETALEAENDDIRAAKYLQYLEKLLRLSNQLSNQKPLKKEYFRKISTKGKN